MAVLGGEQLGRPQQVTVWHRGPRAEEGAALLTETFLRHSSQVLFVFWEQAVEEDTPLSQARLKRALRRAGGRGKVPLPNPEPHTVSWHPAFQGHPQGLREDADPAPRLPSARARGANRPQHTEAVSTDPRPAGSSAHTLLGARGRSNARPTRLEPGLSTPRSPRPAGEGSTISGCRS